MCRCDDERLKFMLQPGSVVGGDTRVEISKPSLGFSLDESIPVVLVPLVDGLLLDDIFDVLSNALYDVFKLATAEF